jgi:DegV family protein with EDD domain
MSVRIVTDSTCDLPPSVAAEHGITVVPLTISFGHESFRDGVDISATEFYHKLESAGQLPRTSQPSPESFATAYREVASPDGVVSIHISGKLSGTINSARNGAAMLEGGTTIEFVDSRMVAFGLGAIVLEAARVAEAGGDLEAVAGAARDAIPRTRVLAVVDTLEYLRRGGRIGRASSLLGSVLDIKPMLAVEDGEVVPAGRVRSRAKAIEKLVEAATSVNASAVYVASAANPQRASALIERLRPRMPEATFMQGDLGPTVGAYTGPNALGLATLERAR